MNELTATDIKELTPEQLGGEIRLLTQQARRMALSYGIQIGYRLHIAHEKVGPHGWAEWLKRETDFSAAAASRFESLYEGYGEEQGSLFGVGNKFPTLENISVSNALRLLAVPEEERETVAAELDAGKLSARELEKALQERDEAQKRALEAERALHEAEEGEGLALAELQEKLDAALEDGRKGKEAMRRQDELEEKLEDAGRRLQEAREQIKELESRPVEVAVERDEKAIEEAAAAATAKVTAEYTGRLQKLQTALEKAENKAEKLKAKADRAEAAAGEKATEAAKEAEQLRQELETAKRKLQLADADVTAFGIHFNAGQKELLEAFGSLRKIAERDPETAQKLTKAFSQLMSILEERISAIEKKTEEGKEQ